MTFLEQIFALICVVLLCASAYYHYKLISCQAQITTAAATTAAAANTAAATTIAAERMSNPLEATFATSLLNKESDSAKNAQGLTMDDIGLGNLLNGGIASTQW